MAIEPTDIDFLRAEMVNADNEIRREMRDHVGKLDSRTGQLDARLRVMERPLERMGKLEQRLTEEAQQNADQSAAIELQNESIARLVQALDQKDEAIAAKNVSEGIAWRIGRIGLFAALGFGGAYFLHVLAVSQTWIVIVLLVPLSAILLIATGNGYLIGDIVSAAKQKFLG